jgi:hypothetical protein
MIGWMKKTKPKMDIALPMLPMPTLNPTLDRPAAQHAHLFHRDAVLG